MASRYAYERRLIRSIGANAQPHGLWRVTTRGFSTVKISVNVAVKVDVARMLWAIIILATVFWN
jgi:hypothetical protein